MSKTITIEVTADDIANGIRGKCKKCPVALALSRSFSLSKSDWAKSESRMITIKKHGRIMKYSTPPFVYFFMALFNGGSNVYPFTFQLTKK